MVRKQSEDRPFFRAVQRFTQTSRGCDATASDGDLNIAHAIALFIFYYKLSLKQLTQSKIKIQTLSRAILIVAEKQ